MRELVSKATEQADGRGNQNQLWTRKRCEGEQAMRSGLSHLRRVIRKSAALRHAISIFFVALGFCGLCGAQESNPQGRVGILTPPSIDQVRDAVLLASESSELSIDAKLLKVTHRDDLEDLLSSLVRVRRIQGLYLYQVDVSTPARFDGPISGLLGSWQFECVSPWTWIIAVAARKPGAYELYSFQGKADGTEGTEEFNRFMSQFSVSLSKYDLANFAAFFLETAIPMRPGELVFDQETLRVVVGLRYYARYDDLWRSLDAYSQWSQAYSDEERILEVAPKAEIEKSGRYIVTLNRVIGTEFTHPQLQQWQVEVSLGGNVWATAMRPIFPKAARWVFYDSPELPNLAPFRP
jgi:hypothetical protein